MYSPEESCFYQLCDRLITTLAEEEKIIISLNCERSQFTRFNNGKVRHCGIVDDGMLTIALIRHSQEATASFAFTGDWQTDWHLAMENLKYLRSQELPPNPYVVLPELGDSSRETYSGKLLANETYLEAILAPVAGLDFTGFYASGTIMRGQFNGMKHWFATAAFMLDYSIFTPHNRAVKGVYAGRDWEQTTYNSQIQDCHRQIMSLDKPIKTIPRGDYRVYFAPRAAADLLEMVANNVGAAALEQGSSALLELTQGSQTLSPYLYLTEDFRNGHGPRFNELGITAPLVLPVIRAGQLVNPLVAAKTAKEYGLVANGAGRSEGMRSPVVGMGDLAPAEILTRLGTGLYLSDLHYLNWSDRPKGRITGMTRYACFWVEGGEIVAPIANLRFDDSIYNFLGKHLEALTNYQEFIPDRNTYGSRSLGGILTPGLLVSSFRFTL